MGERGALGTVLVVDDDAVVGEAVAAALELLGYAVLSAVDEQALEIAHRLQPDVILLDLTMPRLDGVEMCRRVRARPTSARIPISAMSDPERLLAAALLDVDDRLAKPVDLAAVTDAVARQGDAGRR